MVEMRFAPLWTGTFAGGFFQSFTGLLVFVSLSCFIGYFFILKRTLRELDPAAVIPERVQKAFDVLQEGVLILDDKEQIMMANTSFANLFNKSPDVLIGKKGSELGWHGVQNQDQFHQLPWFKVLREGQEQKNASLSLVDSLGKKIKLAVNAAMVPDSSGKCRGCLVTFDDITQIEEKNFELSNLVEQLQISHDDIQGKTEELEFLASRDPLTLCLNRRSLDLSFRGLFTRAQKDNLNLSCLMVDIDFFKSVNDRYGHATGDQVIKAIADVLKTSTRDSDLVGRYGGEEFCLILPNIQQQKAVEIAERIRHTVSKEPCGGVQVSVSIGVSSLVPQTNKPDELINQADKALYVAKNTGRNRVVLWGDKEFQSTEKQHSAEEGNEESGQEDANARLQKRIKELEIQLHKKTLEFEHYELYDYKTGLPTRFLFEDRINHEIARGKRNDSLVVVLSITVDTAKRVYDTMGQNAAELLMKACSKRLNDVLREDIDTVAVLEDDQVNSTVSLLNQTDFGVLLTDIQQVDHITWVIKRLLDAFTKPFYVKESEIHATVYIGVSIYPHDGHTVEALYTSASNASSHALKTKGKDRYLFASHNLNQQAKLQLTIENALHSAIKNDELELLYQPLIGAQSGKICSLEALMRWKSTELGEVSPNEFIPVAEHSGLIDQLGDWAMQRACQQIKDWQQQQLCFGRVAINLSGMQLQQRNLASRIESLLNDFGLGKEVLEIELTESSLVNSYDKDFVVLNKLHDMGLRITMDDFGTGYSSLSYLKDIPLSCLKIDRSFTQGIGKDKTSEKLMASIVSMAHSLGLEVVAEGIEKAIQAEHLRKLGCDYFQGYYFSEPVNAEKIKEILRKD